MNDTYRYAAFISYSHKDKAWGQRLHRALERYSIPKRVRGLEGRDGPVGARIFPVFRDREELPSSSDLNEQIADALKQSATLIVICSPQAATSRWVNEEIRIFKAIGRASRILALIVDGTPNAAETGAPASEECFPAALRYRVAPDGTLTSERVEPVAADARPEGDGEENARLKIIAGVLGIGFDQLRQRDLEAQRSRLRRIAAVSGSVAIALVGLLVLSLYFARQARDERNRALNHLGDSYAERAREFAARGEVDLATRTALMAIRLSEGRSTLAVEVLRDAGARLNLRARFPINIHPGARFALSPDEQVVVSPVGNDALAWGTANAEPRLSFRGHTRAVRTVEFSPDGLRLVTASEDGTARVWDARTGQSLGTLGDGRDEIWFARFWRNGSVIVTTTIKGKVQLWDAAGFREMATLPLSDEAREHFDRPHVPHAGLLGGIVGLEVSADGRKIAMGGRAAVALFVFDRAGTPQSTFVHTGFLDSLNFSPDSAMLATAALSQIQLWNAETGAPTGVTPSEQYTGPLAYSRNGNLLAIATRNGVAISDGGAQPVEKFTSPDNGAVEAIEFSRDGTFIAIARGGGQIEVHALDEENDTTVTLWGHSTTVQGLQFSSDGKTLYSSALDGTVRQWHVRSTATPELATVPLVAHRASGVVFAGGRLFIEGAEGLRSLDLSTVKADAEPFLAAANLSVSRKGDRVAAGGVRSVWIIDAASRKSVAMAPVDVPDDQLGVLGPFVWSPDDAVIAGATVDGGVALWNTQTGSLVRSFKNGRGVPVESLAFTRDGSKLVLRDTEGRVEVRRLDGALLFEIGGAGARHEAFAVSPSADLIATVGQGAEIQLWDPGTGTSVGTLAGHGRGPLGHTILAVGFSEDGRYLHSRSQDDTARIWDVATRANVTTLALDSGSFYGCVAVLPGGRQIVLNSMGEGARISDLATGLLSLVLPDSADCPVFTPDRKFAASPTYRGAILWDTSRLTMTAAELVAAACERGQLPATARTFTAMEGDHDPMIKNLRLDSQGREIDVCTGAAAASRPPR